MWRYIVAGILIVIGLIEVILALHKPMRDELMRNSPIQAGLASPLYLLLAGGSAFVIALVLILYPRFL